MASFDVGGGSRREPNRERPIIPRVDWLLCLVGFLLVTAVWSTMARLEAFARVPGVQADPAPPPDRQLHQPSTARAFERAWRPGSTVARTPVPRCSVPLGRAGVAGLCLERQLAVQ